MSPDDRDGEIRRLRAEVGRLYLVVMEDHSRMRGGRPCHCVYCEAARRHFAGEEAAGVATE